MLVVNFTACGNDGFNTTLVQGQFDCVYCEGMESFLYFPLLMMSCYFQSSFYFYFFELRG